MCVWGVLGGCELVIVKMQKKVGEGGSCDWGPKIELL